MQLCANLPTLPAAKGQLPPLPECSSLPPCFGRVVLLCAGNSFLCFYLEMTSRQKATSGSCWFPVSWGSHYLISVRSCCISFLQVHDFWRQNGWPGNRYFIKVRIRPSACHFFISMLFMMGPKSKEWRDDLLSHMLWKSSCNIVIISI